MRFSRRAHLVGGGPFDGGSTPLLLPDTAADPEFVCCLNSAAWEHYARQDDGRYRYAGPCAEDTHDGWPLPHEHRCCCGQSGCDGSGPWPDQSRS